MDIRRCYIPFRVDAIATCDRLPGDLKSCAAAGLTERLREVLACRSSRRAGTVKLRPISPRQDNAGCASRRVRGRGRLHDRSSVTHLRLCRTSDKGTARQMPLHSTSLRSGHAPRDRTGVSAVHEPRLLGHVRGRRNPFLLPVLRRSHRRRLRLGPPARPAPARANSRPSGPTATIPSASRVSGGSASCSRSRPRIRSSPSAKVRPSSSAPTRSASTSASIPARSGSSTRA